MSRNTSVDGMAEAILQGLKEYKSLANDEMKKAVNKASSQVKKEIQATAPKLTGSYAKHWSIKTTTNNSSALTKVVYCTAPEYALAHLLENGHAKRGGGRVEGIPHIAPAEQHGIETLKNEIEKALRQ